MGERIPSFFGPTTFLSWKIKTKYVASADPPKQLIEICLIFWFFKLDLDNLVENTSNFENPIETIRKGNDLLKFKWNSIQQEIQDEYI